MVDNDRMNALLKSFFEDHDHGREAMQNATVTENICFIDYLENNCIPKARELDKEKDLQYFTEYDIHFRMLTLEKIMRLHRFGVVISKETNHFYSMNKNIIVLVDFSEADYLKESLEKQNFDIEIREISNDDFAAMVEDMSRTGFKSVEFTDGRLRPLIVPRDTILKSDRIETTHNPDLYIESLVFLQEAKKFGKEGKGVIVKTDSPISLAVKKAKFLVPAIVQSKEGNQMQVKYPFLNTNVKGQKVLPVATDRKEYESFIKNPVMKDYNNLPQDKKACIELPFVEIYRIFTTDKFFGVAVNPMGYNFVINKQVMEVIAKDVSLTNNPDIKIERNGQEVVFPDEEAPAPARKKYSQDETSDLRRKVLQHFISTQQEIIEKNKDADTQQARDKVKKAESKLEEFKRQLEELDD